MTPGSRRIEDAFGTLLRSAAKRWQFRSQAARLYSVPPPETTAMHTRLTRRAWLTATATGLAAAPAVAAEPPPAEPFGYCLNTSTISGQKLSLVEEVELAARAGYRGIEPWVRELEQY